MFYFTIAVWFWRVHLNELPTQSKDVYLPGETCSAPHFGKLHHDQVLMLVACLHTQGLSLPSVSKSGVDWLRRIFFPLSFYFSFLIGSIWPIYVRKETAAPLEA